MKLKLFFSLMLVFLLSLISFNSIHAYDVKVDLQSYRPYYVSPGETFDIIFKFKNEGNNAINKITAITVDEYPFRLASDEVEINNLLPGESETASFTVYVEGDAIEKEYDIELEYEIDGNEESENFEIKVRPNEVFVNIASRTEPEKSIPGQKTKLKITINNNAESNIRDLIIKINLSELPFSSVDGVTEKKIDRMTYQESEEVIFELNVLSDAEIKTYKIPIQISYYDSFGNSIAKPQSVSLDVFSEPSLEISIKKSELIKEMQSKINIQFVNNGLSNIKFFEVRIINLGNYEIIGTNYYYIGDLDSDDYETLELNLIPKQENIDLILDITYKDINNKEYTKQAILKPRIYTTSEAKKAELIKTNYIGTILFIIIILIVIFFVYKRIRKKRKNA